MKGWMNKVLWDFTHHTLDLGVVAVTWVPLMNYFHGDPVPTFIMSIPVLYLADILVVQGVMKLLKWNRG